MKSPLSLFYSAFGIASARSWTSTAVRRTSRLYQNAHTVIEDENTEYTIISPQVEAPRKKYTTLEGSSFLPLPSLSPQQYSALDLHIFLSFLDLPRWIAWKLFWEDFNHRFNDLWTLSSSPHKPLREVQGKKALQSSSLLSTWICKGKQNPDPSVAFQI